MLCVAVFTASFLNNIIVSLFISFWVFVYVKPAALFVKDFNLRWLVRVLSDLFIYFNLTWTFNSWTVTSSKILANKDVSFYLLLLFLSIWDEYNSLNCFHLFWWVAVEYARSRYTWGFLMRLWTLVIIKLSSVLCSEISEDSRFKVWE